MSLMRYPGGKEKFSKVIVPILHKLQKKYSLYHYLEPFAGAGTIGNQFLAENKEIQNAQFNDYDLGIAAIYKAILNHKDLLIELIRLFEPNIEDFFAFKKVLTELEISREFRAKFSYAEIALMKIAVHQMSLSGLGLRTDSPIGGKTQRGKYKIDHHWSPTLLIQTVEKLHKLYVEKDLLVTHYSVLYENLFPEYISSLTYLDPPYYQQGENLYFHSFKAEDHTTLATVLQNQNNDNYWLLSYDDCPEIRKLYEWANIIEVNTKYSIDTIKNTKELLISNANLN